MKEYATESIRNIALVSHGGGGKTSLGEALLYLTGALTRMGKIEDGNTVSDFEEEEIRRVISLSTSVLPVEFQDHKINLLDTPGFTDFIGEVISALCVADGAMVLVDSVAGVEVGTEIVWDYCNSFNLPRFVVISKMDRDNANFHNALASAREMAAGVNLVPVQLPWGEKQDMKGVIDLLTMKARPGSGKDAVDIPAEYADAAEEARIGLIEAAAEGDDTLLEKYLNGEDLTPAEITRGFKAGVMTASIVPVFVTAATAELGVIPIAEAALSFLPSPSEAQPRKAEGATGEELLTADDAGPLGVYVWKTTADPFVGKMTYLRVLSGILNADTRIYNHTRGEEERLGSLYVMRGKEQLNVPNLHSGDIGIVAKLSETETNDTLGEKSHKLAIPAPDYPNALYSVAVMPKTQADSTKISPTLTRLCEEDPTLSWRQEASTKETILQGMGDQHIDVAIRKAESKFQVALNTKIPKVPYQETITRQGAAQYRHKKQTGGAGQFGEVHLRIEPLPDEDFIFANEVFGGAISQGFMPAIEKGVRNVMKAGVLAGFPVQNVKVAVVDGKEHPVDSKAVAFEVAGREAFKLAFHDAKPVLLEPIMNIRVTVPESNMGDVLGDLNTRRARVQGMETDRGRSVVTAKVPLAEIQRYTSELRSITGGRGVFSMELDHYEVVPNHVAEQVIASREKEEETE
ncbi:MAG: elongation factor G [Anaerolineales bacterium]|nr:elongation factor G [Anaerolineales bacterium]